MIKGSMLKNGSHNVYRSLTRCSPRHRTRRCLASSVTQRKKGPYDVLFCGTDESSVACLQAIIAAKDIWRSIHVLTPSESRKGRGGKELYVRPSAPARSFAVKQALPAHQVPKLSKEERKTWLPPTPFENLRADQVLVTACFGSLLPVSFLSAFEPDKRLNVHPSLLPKYRGSSPIIWAVANGDTETGICVQRLAKGFDTGDIVAARAGIVIPPDATGRSLAHSLTPMSAELLVQALRDMRDGKQVAAPQDPSQVSYAPDIARETTRVVYRHQSAVVLDRMHRAMSHMECLWTTFHGVQLHLGGVTIASLSEIQQVRERYPDVSVSPGMGMFLKSGQAAQLLIACGPEDAVSQEEVTWLAVERVKAAGKKWYEVKDWWNGIPSGERKRGWVEFDAS